MQAVIATAGRRIVQRLVEVVAAEEPLEGTPGLIEPEAIIGRLEGFDAGRYRGLRLDRLLVETGPRAAATIEPVRADRHEVAVAGLLGHQPAQRLQPQLQRPLPMRPAMAAAADERVRQLRVDVAQDRLEPRPILLALRLVQANQLFGQPIVDGTDVAVAAQMLEVFLHADQPECPGAWRAHGLQLRQGLKKKLGCPLLEATVLRTSQTHAQHPKTAPEAVV